MNNELPINIDNVNAEISNPNLAINKITAKSKDIKAKMKLKYLLYKLERTCSLNKFM